MRTRKRLDDLGRRVGSIERLLDKLDRSLERIELVTVVREPNTGMSAEAYDGLRKQVIAAVNARMAHLRQLAQFDAAVQVGTSSQELETLVREWREQNELQVVEDITLLDAFELVGPEAAEGRRLIRPAYVDAITGRVIRAGIVERVDEPQVTAVTPAPAGDQGGSDPSGDRLEEMANDNEAATDEESVASGGSQ